MRLITLFFLIPMAAHAQVNLCIDGKGRKTYTEASCAELGMTPAGVIADIKPKPKKCYDMAAQLESIKKTANRLRTTPSALNTNEAMAIVWDGEIERHEMQYKKECER